MRYRPKLVNGDFWGIFGFFREFTGILRDFTGFFGNFVGIFGFLIGFWGEATKTLLRQAQDRKDTKNSLF